MTLIVNLIGGPGTGKSTTAAGTFFELKQRGINCEYVAEYAKDLVWGRTTETLGNQVYIFGKQYHRLWRMLGQVDVVVTDCPLFMSLYYGKDLPPSFTPLVLDMFLEMNNFTVFLHRVKEFNPAGRTQNEEKAREIDDALLNLLNHHAISYLHMDANRSAPAMLADMIEYRLTCERGR